MGSVSASLFLSLEPSSPLPTTHPSRPSLLLLHLRQGMTLLFSEHGSNIGAFDKDPEVVKATLKKASQTEGLDTSLVHGFSTLQKLMSAFTPNKPRIVVFSLPHGSVVDDVLEETGPLMSKGDLIVDGGNEQYGSTERRQKRAREEWGLKYLGMGVSGGYQAARRGPSMSAGGEKEAYEMVSSTRLVFLSARSFSPRLTKRRSETGRAVAQEVGRQDSQWRLLRWVGWARRKWELW